MAGEIRIHSNSANKSRLLIAFITLYIVWGSTYLAIKYAIDGIPPFLMGAIRFLCAGTLLYMLVWIKGTAHPQKKHWLSAFIIGFLLLAMGNGGVMLAEQYVPTGAVSLMVALVPLYIILLENRGKAPKPLTILGLILGSLGVFTLVKPANLSVSSSQELLGLAIVMIGSMGWSIGSIYSRSAKLPNSMLQSTAMQMLCGGLSLLVLSIASGEPSRFSVQNVTMQSIFAIVYLIIFGSIIGYSAYLYLLKHVSPSKVSTYAYVNPVVAIFLGSAFLKEPITPNIIFAGLMIISAVYLINKGSSSKSLLKIDCNKECLDYEPQRR